MRRLSLDAIVSIAAELTAHGSAYPSRIVYLCAHVLPTMDAEKAPYHGTTEEWDVYLDSYGIRPTEKRFVIDGFHEFELMDLPRSYEKEHMDHLTWTLKHVGHRVMKADADAQSDAH